MSKKGKRIVAAHLLNNYSGSPQILAQSLKALSDWGQEIDLYTNSGDGFLNQLPVNHKKVWYQWSPNRFRRLLNYSISQLILFFKLLRYWNQPVVIYVNTLLPAGAGLAGWIMGKEVVYHVHETHVDPPAFNRILLKVISLSAKHLIYVSDYIASFHDFHDIPSQIVHNALPDHFVEKADHQVALSTPNKVFTVLMISSLVKVKGIGEFVKLAEITPEVSFVLVLGQSQTEIDRFYKDTFIPNNITIYPVQTNVHPFYQDADLIVNLSHPELCVESFGMTIIEGMYYGLPAIVPPVGGPTEIVREGKEGYHMDARKLDMISQKILNLKHSPSTFDQLSLQAKERAQAFTADQFSQKIKNALSDI